MTLEEQYFASMVTFYDRAIDGVTDAIVDFTATRRKWVDALEAYKASGEVPAAFKHGFDEFKFKKHQEADF